MRAARIHLAGELEGDREVLSASSLRPSRSYEPSLPAEMRPIASSAARLSSALWYSSSASR